MHHKIANIVSGYILLISIASCSNKTYTTLRWQKEGIIIDGKSKEWSSPLRYYDQASKLSYELTNDAENIYVAFSAKEQSTIMKIMQKGLRFSIDTAMGKGRYPMQFTVPYINSKDKNHPGIGEFANEQMPPDFQNDTTKRNDHHPMGRGDKHPHNGENADSGALPPEHTLSFFVQGINTFRDADSVLTTPNRYGIEMAINQDPQKLFCEMKIPFKLLYKKQFLASDTIKPYFFQVNLEQIEMAFSLEKQHPQGPPPGAGGEGGPGGGGPPSGGDFGGRSGGGGFGGGSDGHGDGNFGGGRGNGGHPEGGRPIATDNGNEQNANVIRFQFRPSLLVNTNK